MKHLAVRASGKMSPRAIFATSAWLSAAMLASVATAELAGSVDACGRINPCRLPVTNTPVYSAVAALGCGDMRCHGTVCWQRHWQLVLQFLALPTCVTLCYAASYSFLLDLGHGLSSFFLRKLWLSKLLPTLIIASNLHQCATLLCVSRSRLKVSGLGCQYAGSNAIWYFGSHSASLELSKAFCSVQGRSKSVPTT